jgi:Protein of unknown function (DUF2012).
MTRGTCLGALVGALLIGFGSGARGGDVKGKVDFEGTAPKSTRLMMNADPVCMKAHKDPVYTEDVVVNPNKTLKNVLVYVKDGLGGRKFDGSSAAKLSLEQKGCQYFPHVIGIQTGQELDVVNDDPTLHNVHSLSKVNSQFNAAQPKQGMRLVKRFDKAETFRVKCEVHGWMGAYIGVFEHPFFAVTGEDGSFTIKGLPAGEYTLEAWHEKYGTQTLKVKVGGSGEAQAKFTYAAK